MTIWIISYTVEVIDQSGTVTVETGSMNRGIAQRHVANHLLRTGEAAPDAFAASDIAVSYEPDVE